VAERLEPRQGVREVALRCAVAGGAAGLACAVVECGLASVLQPLLSPFASYAFPLPFLVLPFLVYPIVCALASAVVGITLTVGLRRPPVAGGVPAFSAIVSLVLLVAATSVRCGFLGTFSLLAVAAACAFLISIAVVGAVPWDGIAHRLRALTSPWAASIVLIGPLWLSKDVLARSPIAVKGAATAIVLFGVCVVALIPRRADGEPRTRAARRREALAAAAVIGPALAIARERPGDLPRLTLAAGGRPNVLLVTMDTVRADHLPLYGYDRDTAPHLRNLAEAATLYLHVIAPSNYTLPSHGSMFTGLYATTHGAHMLRENGPDAPLASSAATLAETLSRMGYVTASVSANNGYLGRAFGLHRGFGYWDARVPAEYLPRNVLRNVFERRSPAPYRRAEDIARQTSILIREMARRRSPFFVFVNFMDAHAPYAPPSPFRDLFPGRRPGTSSAELTDRLSEDMRRGRLDVRPAERAHLVSQYDGGIAYIDFCLADLLETLRRQGVYENTLVIITSDHGESFGEKGLIDHGNALYQNEIRVPLIIKYPGQTEKAVGTEVVSLTDLFPTTLAVVGLERHANVHGQDLRHAVRRSDPPVFSEAFPPRLGRVERTIVVGSLKLIVSRDGKRQLYDLSRDPDETQNLVSAGRNLSLGQGLEDALDRWAITLPRPLGQRPATLDEETLRRLRSLGYLR
jgi:arylsulfatase A-like enzyme